MPQSSPPYICTIFAQSSYSCTLKIEAGGPSKMLLTAYQMVTHPRRPSHSVGFEVLTAVVRKSSVFALINCFIFDCGFRVVVHKFALIALYYHDLCGVTVDGVWIGKWIY
jgi:hypothetical protein